MALEFDMVIDTKIFCEKLREVPKGEVITFEELGKVIKRKTGGDDPYLASAIKIIEKELSTVFNNIYSIGYQRLLDEDIPEIVPVVAITRVNRTMKTAIRRTGYANDTFLDNASRLKKATSLAHMGAIEQATGIKKYKKLLDEAFKAGIPPSPAEVFEEYVNAKKKYN